MDVFRIGLGLRFIDIAYLMALYLSRSGFRTISKGIQELIEKLFNKDFRLIMQAMAVLLLGLSLRRVQLAIDRSQVTTCVEKLT